MSAPRVLVLDDEPTIVEVLITRLEAHGYLVDGFSDPHAALDALGRRPYSLLLTDLKMPAMDGITVLEKARHIDADVEVIIFTAYGSIDGAVEAIKKGAYDYVLKPFEPAELMAKIEKAIEKRDLKQRVRELEQEVGDGMVHQMYARSAVMKRVLGLTRQVSAADSTVLVLGESGTGKELIARMLHHESRRRSRKLVVMDCGATPPSLIEGELFGYMKGAYTGAARDKRGIIEEADGGTLFLDEIGNISPEMQTRLLRVLESGEFRRVGELGQRRVDIRVIAATNADLEQKVRDGSFREDLYYRLKVITITLPPLRDRREDIPGLVQIFVNEFSRKTGKSQVGIVREAMEILQHYSWPGNVRELRNVIESAVVLCRDECITPDELIFSGLVDMEPAGLDDEVAEGLNRLEQQEREMLVDALNRAGWVQKEAAELLGISRRVMHYKIKKYDIELPAN